MNVIVLPGSTIPIRDMQGDIHQATVAASRITDGLLSLTLSVQKPIPELMAPVI